MDVRTLCLAVLTKGDATGYEIKKMFEEGPFAHFQSASFGSIYPALSRLLSEGLVEARAQEQDGRPDKKVYSITPAGNALVDAALTVTPEADTFRSDFLFLLFFATRLPEARVIELIDQRVDMYRAKQNHIAEQMAAREQNDCRRRSRPRDRGRFRHLPVSGRRRLSGKPERPLDRGTARLSRAAP